MHGQCNLLKKNKNLETKRSYKIHHYCALYILRLHWLINNGAHEFTHIVLGSKATTRQNGVSRISGATYGSQVVPWWIVDSGYRLTVYCRKPTISKTPMWLEYVSQ